MYTIDDIKNSIINENCLTGLSKIPDACIDCCVTSPPYFGLRDYGKDEQIGLEETPEKFVESLVKVFEEVRRILKPQGTLWLNLGDSYASGKVGRDDTDKAGRERLSKFGNKGYANKDINEITPVKIRKLANGFKSKDLIGIPWMVAFALRAAGWYLRQDIIWHKPNPMPESVTDRCTKSHEYIFLLSKSAKYYYDHKSIMQDVIKEYTGRAATFDRSGNDVSQHVIPGQKYAQHRARKSGNKERKNGNERGCPENSGSNVCSSVPWEGVKANKRSVWTVTTKPFSEAHFATFPEDLIVDCIKAGCPEDGIVLDPFMGAGTTALVSRKLNRNYTGFEINADYIKIAEKRLKDELGMFL